MEGLEKPNLKSNEGYNGDNAESFFQTQSKNIHLLTQKKALITILLTTMLVSFESHGFYMPISTTKGNNNDKAKFLNECIEQIPSLCPNDSTYIYPHNHTSKIAGINSKNTHINYHRKSKHVVSILNDFSKMVSAQKNTRDRKIDNLEKLWGYVNDSLSNITDPEQKNLYKGQWSSVVSKIFELRDSAKMPVKVNGLRRVIDNFKKVISSDFGIRKNPLKRHKQEFHLGHDFTCAIGTKIYSIDKGIVVETGSNDDFGAYIIIDHNEGVKSFYGHLSAIKVKKGAKVHSETIIGKSGGAVKEEENNSEEKGPDTEHEGSIEKVKKKKEKTTGPHLHFQLILNDEILVDPSVIYKPTSPKKGDPYITKYAYQSVL